MRYIVVVHGRSRWGKGGEKAQQIDVVSSPVAWLRECSSVTASEITPWSVLARSWLEGTAYY